MVITDDCIRYQLYLLVAMVITDDCIRYQLYLLVAMVITDDCIMIPVIFVGCHGDH